MSEEQLRDVLSRVVPEPPDTVADPAAVVRAARVRRRAVVAGAVAVVAVVAVGGVLGGRALVDDDSGPLVADEPTISADPYAAASCPDVDALPANGPLPDEIVAVRYCAVPFNGFPAQSGPPDALVDGLGTFTKKVSALPAADPARCATIDVLPTDSRLLLELADGSLASVPTGLCQDVIVGGKTVDASDATQAFMGALLAQRDGFAYSPSDGPRPVTCEDSTAGPVTPGHETFVLAVTCAPGEAGIGTSLSDDAVSLLNERWSNASRPENYDDTVEDPCTELAESPSTIVARTDRGDAVRLTISPCGFSFYDTYEFELPSFRFDLTLGELNAS